MEQEREAIEQHVRNLENQVRLQYEELEAMRAANILAAGKRPKERLPTLREFSGKRNEWDEWHLAARNKLLADGLAIGSAKQQFLYLYSRLTGTAASTVHAKAEHLSTAEDSSGSEFLIYLDTIYGDPNKKSRALQSLYNIRQKDSELFANFLPKFETILANAGGAEFQDEQKISLLKNAINLPLKYYLVGAHGIPTTWSGFVSHLHTISSDLTALQTSSKFTKTHIGTNGYNQSNSANTSSEMDWEPTKVRSNKQVMNTKAAKRATWVPQETLDFRRKKGLCLRCGHLGHIVKDCAFRPAVPPLQTNRTNIGEEMALARAESNTAEEDQLAEEERELKE